MKKYWKIFIAFRKNQLMKMVEYRGDFFFWLFVSLMWTWFNYFYLGLVVSQGKGIEGWSYDQVNIILSFYTMLDSFTWSVFWPNMSRFTREVFNGELSKYLVKPVNTVYLLLTQEITYHNLPRFLVGLAVLIHTINKLQITPSWWQVLLTIVTFVAGLLLIYSCWFILATTSFWVEKLDNINDIMPQFRSVYQVPVSIFTGITGFIFSFIIPLGLVTTVPSEVILGRENYKMVIYLVLISTIFFIIAVKFFQKSISKYTSVGG